MILTQVIAQADRKWNQGLVGTKNGSNATFTTPDEFVSDSINVRWSGRALFLPDDFTVSESGGVGTGYDTILLNHPEKPLPDDILVADYTAII